MADTAAEELIGLLTDLTFREELQWMKTPGEDVFRTDLGSGSVRIAPAGFAPSTFVVNKWTVTVSDRNGRVIDTFVPDDGTPEYTLLARLYPRIRRTVLGIDASLEAILRELRDRTERGKAKEE
jgi:hypothetical protein